MMDSKVRYARNGEVHLAYRVFGAGPRDIVLVPGTVSHVELFWEMPANEYLLTRLSSFARVIVFDKRGQGLSDRVATQTMDERVDDLRAVMDAVGSERASIYGWSEGGQMSLMFAATYPERVSCLVLYGAFASARSEPWCVSQLSFDHFLASLTKHWGEGVLVKLNAPSRIHDEAFVRCFGRLERAVASPGSIQALLRTNYEFDVMRHLASIRVPTLIMHRQGDTLVPVQAGRYLAWNIPGASYLNCRETITCYQAFDLDVLDVLIDRIEDFVAGSRLSRGGPEIADTHRRALIETIETGSAGANSRNGHFVPNSGNGVQGYAIETTRECARAVFQREGEYWTVSWQGELVRFKDAKGFHYIKYLLANSGRQIPASELAMVGKTPEPIPLTIEDGRWVTSLGDAEPILDTKARASYQKRIAELREELAEAHTRNDSGQAMRLRWELEQLGDQIVAAVGLRGQTRTANSHRERARLMVTKAIKAAIAR